ncbi:F-box domain-containing protein [Piedraia hortae CBS 480.64]|uniref:F-box domain-containing protein n=1 Tax=Piedraia hortae CBS 480.64 TaxID=1314780 RepID=A0A6A7C773_9PEZI|nr:F-box domain-containing protein [Piedraia hortae CBS 480.64]
MEKRGREPSTERLSSHKRQKVSNGLPELCDELILHIFSYLTASQLAACQRLSRKFQLLAEDGQLWKALYYNRFAKPRLNLIPKEIETPRKWLDEDQPMESSKPRNWMKQYKLELNWVRGICAVREIEVASQATVPPTLIKLSDGKIYMADHNDGLSAWQIKGERRELAQTPLVSPSKSPPQTPTALAVDSEEATCKILVAFEDGSFQIYLLDQTSSSIKHGYSHPPSSDGPLVDVALAWPYAVTLSESQTLSLYQFHDHPSCGQTSSLEAPRLLHSLKGRSVQPPCSISIRLIESRIIISIIDSVATLFTGWTVAIQEIRVSPDGDLCESNIASAIGKYGRPPAPSLLPFISTRRSLAKPITVSYTHPYLLVSRPNNTLSLYVVESTGASLSIGTETCLWGHTSAVLGAQVSGNGKAVSVSQLGEELRVWELHGGDTKSSACELSVKLKPDVRSQNSVAPSRESDAPSREPKTAPNRGWIDFDDENVMLLKEQTHGGQALVVYDFT